jgi:hypothetical protein
LFHLEKMAVPSNTVVSLGRGCDTCNSNNNIKIMYLLQLLFLMLLKKYHQRKAKTKRKFSDIISFTWYVALTIQPLLA